MADNIDFPVPDGTIIRTRDDGGVHTPIGLIERSFQACDGGAGGEMAMTAGTYSAGDAMTDGVGFSIEPGLYTLSRMKVVTSAGGTLPTGLSIGLVNYQAANEPGWQTDAQPFSSGWSGGVGSEPLALEVVSNFVPLYGTQMAYVQTEDVGRVINVNPGMDSLRIIPFTTTAVVAGITPGELLIVTGIIERLGDVVGA